MSIQLSQPISTASQRYVTNQTTKKNCPHINKKEQDSSSKKKQIIIGTTAIVTSGLAIAYFIKSRGKNTLPTPPSVPIQPPPVGEITEAVASPIIEELKSAYKKLILKFPKDEPYYKSLAKAIGLKAGEEYRLASITGEAQLTSILKNATAQDFAVGENLSGVKNRTLRINLHNHTTASDGKLTPAEILEQARKWADEIVAKHGNDNKPPFVLGITDHDCVDGAKEIVNIVSQNPEKYRNLKIVLGGEFSVAYTNPKDVKSPMNFELIGYALNPFNEVINNFLKTIRTERGKYVQKYIDIIQKEFPKYEFSLKETETFHANLKNMRTNGVLYLTREYLTHKMFLTEYIEQINSKILPREAEKINATKLFAEIKDEFYNIKDARGYKGNAIATYYKEYVLTPLVEKYLTPANREEFENIFTTKLEHQEKRLKEILESLLPKIDDKSGYIIRPDEWFNVVRTSGSEGFFGIAHPGLINASMYSDDVAKVCQEKGYDNGQHLAWRLYSALKRDGGELFRATEANYQSYPHRDNGALFWQKYMGEKKADEFNLLKTGGIDCHKPSIFKKHQTLTIEEIKENNLEGIV